MKEINFRIIELPTHQVLLQKDGFVANENNVTHANKSPTMAQGFWNSIIYSINV